MTTGGIDDRSIARWRLRTQRLTGPPAGSATATVTGLLAVQAENHSQASWAVASRTRDVDATTFARSFDDGAVLRTHVLRPTWHYVHPDDIRWLLGLTAPRIVQRTLRQHQRELDVDDAAIDRSAELIVDALSGEAHLTRDALGERLRDAGLPADGRRLGLMIAHAELSALICSGAVDDGRHTYALLDRRAPNARRLDRDEAVAELTLRYFSGHGPATERDLAYWATMTLTDVRAGLAAVADRLEHFDHGGRTYWFADGPPADGPSTPRGHLLQILDEYHHGYQDSRWTLDASGIVPRGRAAAIGMVLVDGQMVGDMRRTVGATEVVFDIGLYRGLDDEDALAVHDAAERYARYLDLDWRLTLNPLGPGRSPRHGPRSALDLK